MIGDILNKLRTKQDLLPDEAAFAFNALFEHRLAPEQIGALLGMLAQKGETVAEVSAAVSAMRARMIRAHVRADAIDVCGTGGDGAQTLNISTAVAIVLAACGIPVAKHGNRAASSQSGATDVLTALGVNINAPQAVVERCVNELGIGYFAAPLYHPALKDLVPIRKNLGIRTLFNLLGPMCNPAGVTRQMIGVYSPDVMTTVGKVLIGLGAHRVVVVHGHGGLDEVSPTGATNIHSYCNNGTRYSVDEKWIGAADFGIMEHDLALLRGGSPEQNAAALVRLLDGETGAYRDTVILNAATAIRFLEAGPDADRPASRAAEAIDSGKAKAVLDRWITMSNQS